MIYSAFGLSLASERPIPGLGPQAEPSANADTQIWLNPEGELSAFRKLHAEPWYSGDIHDDGTAGLQVWKLADGGYFRLLYADGTEFFVNRSGTSVWAAWLPTSTLEDTATYLLGPVLGFVLRLRGINCLHASAVAVGNRAIALSGPAQAGKSTMAAAFARMGHRVLSDDVAAFTDTEGIPCLRPAYPQLRLWPDAVERLYGSADALAPLTPTWEKRALDLTKNGYRFQAQPLPLAAIYILGDRADVAEPRITGLHGREALMILIANSYVGYLLDSVRRRQELEALAQLASVVPVRRVLARDDPASLPRLCSTILEDYEALGCTASPTTAR